MRLAPDTEGRIDMSPERGPRLPPLVRDFCSRAIVVQGTLDNDLRVYLSCGHWFHACGGLFGFMVPCRTCTAIIFPEYADAGEFPA